MTRLKMILAAGCFVAVGAAWSGFARERDEAPQAPAGLAIPVPVPAPKPVQPGTHPITVTGRATDFEGRPVANARISLASLRGRYVKVAEVATGEDGHYEFRDVKMPVERPEGSRGPGGGSFQVHGVADKVGIAWRPQKYFSAGPRPANFVDRVEPFDPPMNYWAGDKIELDLRFPPAAGIGGTIVGDRGNPLAGVRLKIYDCVPLNVPDGYGFEGKLDMLNGSVPASISTTTTDADGRFSFAGMPADCRFRTFLDLKGFPNRGIILATTREAQPRYHGSDVLSGDIRITMATAFDVPVRIVQGDTGRPAHRVRVEAAAELGNSSGSTDDQGLVTLRLTPGPYEVECLPARGTPYLLTIGKLEVKATPPAEPIIIKLDRAAMVEISAVDEETGRGVEGVDILRCTDAADRLERYYVRSWEVATRICHVDYPKTDADGKALVPTGPGKYRFGPGYEARPPWTKLVEDERGEAVECRAGETTRLEFHFRKVPRNPDAGPLRPPGA